MDASEALAGRHILVVEDEAMIALLIEDMLVDLGCVLAGLAHGVDEAMALAADLSPIDAALLDVNLAGRPIFPVADVLRARGIPLVFSSGYGEAGLRETDAASPVLRKPFRLADLAEALTRALG